jgi:hypothetical protein
MLRWLLICISGYIISPTIPRYRGLPNVDTPPRPADGQNLAASVEQAIAESKRVLEMAKIKRETHRIRLDLVLNPPKESRQPLNDSARGRNAAAGEPPEESAPPT